MAIVLYKKRFGKYGSNKYCLCLLFMHVIYVVQRLGLKKEGELGNLNARFEPKNLHQR